MFASNEKRLKTYVGERRVEEKNSASHQTKLYEQLAEELGQDVQATSYAKLAKRVVNKIGEIVTDGAPRVEKSIKDEKGNYIKVLDSTINASATEYLSRAIDQGKLSQLFTAITKIDPKSLSKKARIIVGDLQRPDIKELLNLEYHRVIASKIPKSEQTKELVKATVDVVSGGDKKTLNEIVQQAIEQGIFKSSDLGSDKFKSDVPLDSSNKSEGSKGSKGSKGSIDSTAATSVMTVAELERDLPEFASVMGTIKTTMDKLATDPDASQIYMELKSKDKTKKGDFKRLGRQGFYIDIHIDKDNISFSKMNGNTKTNLDYKQVQPFLKDLNENDLVRTLQQRMASN